MHILLRVLSYVKFLFFVMYQYVIYDKREF